MRSTNQDETLKAKASFERKMKEFGVIVESYYANNGRFAEREFQEEIIKIISLCHFAPQELIIKIVWWKIESKIAHLVQELYYFAPNYPSLRQHQLCSSLSLYLRL